jgi:hypothetical protein
MGKTVVLSDFTKANGGMNKAGKARRVGKGRLGER